MILLVVAQLADLATGLRLPPGAEMNPLAAFLLAVPSLAVAFKVALILYVASLRSWFPWLVTLGAMAGAVGAYSNIRAMA